jgi:HNH endonuclease
MSLSREADLRRILSRCDINDCWHWTGAVANTGYGKAGVGSLLDDTRRVANVHRFVYESLVGPVPEGLVLDHLCRNKTCVNPDHLQPVTKSMNALRGHSPLGARTHCNYGHPFSGANLRLRSTGRGCITCLQAMQQKSRAKLAHRPAPMRVRGHIAVA